MGYIVFNADDFRNDKTRKHIGRATDEERKPLIDLVKRLNGKYVDEKACPTHPQQLQTLNVCLTDGKMSILLSTNDVCHCPEMIERISKISEHEIAMFNGK